MAAGEEEAGGTLVSECAAFLEGSLAESWEGRGFVVPVWAWTDLLAHGSEERIAAAMAHPGRHRPAAHCWRTARSLVAFQLFDLLDEECTLADMQWNVLVPLDLEMASRPDVSRWSPRRWVDALDGAIRNESSTSGCEPTT